MTSKSARVCLKWIILAPFVAVLWIIGHGALGNFLDWLWTR